MSHLHPVMAQCLAPFIGEIAAPAPGRGQISYTWDSPISEPIECHLDYTPAERGSRERGTGMQLETDWPESVELTAAYLRGVDILPLLSSDQIAQIEQLALNNLE